MSCLLGCFKPAVKFYVLDTHQERIREEAPLPDEGADDSPGGLRSGYSAPALLRSRRGTDPSSPRSKNSVFKFRSKRFVTDGLIDEMSTFRSADRVTDKLSRWEVRGAQRPITDFYEKVEFLGEGHFGAVSKWRLKSALGCLDQFVAVKLIHWSTVWGGPWRDMEHEAKVRTELKMLLMLDHPFIVKFREWYEAPCHGIYFVMELCEGKSVQAVLDEICDMESLEERKPHLRQLRRYFRELCYAVSYIHGSSVLHRDLKPDNLILRKEGSSSCVKLIDFGLATLQDGELDEPVGTLPFMAPELFLRKAGSPVDFKEEMDNWALGVMFVWFVTAVHHGSLMHPMLKGDVGEGFNASFYDLYIEYKEARAGERSAWNHELFDGLPEDMVEVADALLVHDPVRRAKAVDVMQMTWVKAEDPAAAASAALIQHGGVVANLRSYHNLSKLHRKILYTVADHADERIVVQLRRTFRALDTNFNGALSKSELVEGFARMDVDISDEDVAFLYNELGDGESGTITFSDWLAAAIGSSMLEKDEPAIRAAFLQLASSGAGVITLADWSKVMSPGDAAEIHDEFGDMTFKKFQEIVDELVSVRNPVLQRSPTTSLGLHLARVFHDSVRLSGVLRRKKTRGIRQRSVTFIDGEAEPEENPSEMARLVSA